MLSCLLMRMVIGKHRLHHYSGPSITDLAICYRSKRGTEFQRNDQEDSLRKVTNNADSLGSVVSDPDVGKQLAAIQILALMDQEGGDYDKGLRLRPDRFINRRLFQAGEFGMYLDLAIEGEGNMKPVLVEWITYTTAWIGGHGYDSTELFN